MDESSWKDSDTTKFFIDLYWIKTVFEVELLLSSYIVIFLSSSEPEFSCCLLSKHFWVLTMSSVLIEIFIFGVG